MRSLAATRLVLLAAALSAATPLWAAGGGHAKGAAPEEHAAEPAGERNAESAAEAPADPPGRCESYAQPPAAAPGKTEVDKTATHGTRPSAGPTPEREGEPLAPYQMVRSLQLVQDRIAAGDHAALPMQQKLLQLIDRRLREAEPSVFDECRNFRSVLVYAMSGGNPTTIDRLMRRLALSREESRLSVGLLSYLHGQPRAAQATLEPVDPMRLPPELGAFVALVRGSVTSIEDPRGAIKLLDKARLLGPGTLVEEAALRRLLAISVTIGDPDRFMFLANAYVRRFLRSPYASQFADAFVAGVTTLHGRLDLAAVERLTALLDPEQERVVYLRIARRAAIEGQTELSAFASRKAVGRNREDPRGQLYSGLAAVIADPSADILGRLRGIDRSQLSESDRQLLDAAETIAAGVVAPAEAALPPKPAAPAPMAARATPPAEPVPTVEEAAGPAGPEEVATDAAEPPAAQTMTQVPPYPSAGEVQYDPTLDEASALVADTRRRLHAIDRMLGETSQ